MVVGTEAGVRGGPRGPGESGERSGGTNGDEDEDEEEREEEDEGGGENEEEDEEEEENEGDEEDEAKMEDEETGVGVEAVKEVDDGAKDLGAEEEDGLENEDEAVGGSGNDAPAAEPPRPTIGATVLRRDRETATIGSSTHLSPPHISVRSHHILLHFFTRTWRLRRVWAPERRQGAARWRRECVHRHRSSRNRTLLPVLVRRRPFGRAWSSTHGRRSGGVGRDDARDVCAQREGARGR